MLDVGFWDLEFGIWNLVLGAWNLVFVASYPCLAPGTWLLAAKSF